MLRKLNFTKRQRIPRQAIDLALRRNVSGVLEFDATLDLSKLALPSDARIFLEASYRSSYMRFDFGTVGALRTPESRTLDEIFSDNTVHFRLKVVDQSAEVGRLLAVADEITLSAIEEGSGDTVPLLPVNFTDLGNRIWNVDFSGATGPLLELNRNVEEIAHIARRDDRFFALVYPAAVKEILTYILVVERFEGDEEGEWWSDWLRWARQFSEAETPRDADEARQWIEDVVSTFAARHQCLQRFATAVAQESD